MNRIIVKDRPALVTGAWRLEDLNAGKLGYPKNGLKVFSCFHCGGGSSMGYKLAGYDVIGGVEIDPQMMKLYHRNVLTGDKSLSFLMGVQDFVRCEMENLPAAMYELDVLDGSPPCSSFSMAGSREKAWGKKKKFREGQADQVLDDLFFHYIDIAKRLRPKVVIAENVKGLIQGNARGYVKMIFQAFREAGYDCQLFLLNASRMGVPQARERTFFVARRLDLALPKVKFLFEQEPIGAAEAMGGLSSKDVADALPLTKMALHLWKRTTPGEGLSSAHLKGSWYAHRRPHPLLPSPTIIAVTPTYHWQEPRLLSPREVVRIQTFPEDYDFCELGAQYVCGMSVPPLMMQRVADAVAAQILSNQ